MKIDSREIYWFLIIFELNKVNMFLFVVFEVNEVNIFLFVLIA